MLKITLYINVYIILMYIHIAQLLGRADHFVVEHAHSRDFFNPSAALRAIQKTFIKDKSTRPVSIERSSPFKLLYVLVMTTTFVR